MKRNHEDLDTRIVLHALDATAVGYKRNVGKCHGTDQAISNCITSWAAILKIVSEYDQEIPQSQTADNPMVPQGRAAQPSRDTRKTN